MIPQTHARILIVDDERSNIEILSDLFGDDHEILFATEGNRALEIAAISKPDIILLDMMMPGINGCEVCRLLKTNPQTRAIPVIFITALGDVATETLGLELGAMDYISKPFSPAVVKMRVNIQIELKRAREQLTLLATLDGLTGIANRRRFDEFIASEWSRASRSRQPMALAMIDIDLFKNYNDHYGHQAGDKCLRKVAKFLETHAGRPGDLVARYGGEEFAFITSTTNGTTALRMTESICGALLSMRLPHTMSPFGYVTVSIGVAAFAPVDGETSELLVRKADEALYHAKKQGRNQAVLFTRE
ncbi:MAG: diguanylate cyclase [Methylobacter sp.]|nr:diguanylate cyclase [Methylobacter sp.]